MNRLCELRDGTIRVVIELDALRFAAENHPAFDRTQDERVPTIKITDIDAFALEIVRAINDEAEDGSTMLTEMLDAAVLKAVEGGCDGIDHEAEGL